MRKHWSFPSAFPVHQKCTQWVWTEKRGYATRSQNASRGFVDKQNRFWLMRFTGPKKCLHRFCGRTQRAHSDTLITLASLSSVQEMLRLHAPMPIEYSGVFRLLHAQKPRDRTSLALTTTRACVSEIIPARRRDDLGPVVFRTTCRQTRTCRSTSELLEMDLTVAQREFAIS